MKTSELTGQTLNITVHNLLHPEEPIKEGCSAPPYAYDWSFGGPIIDSEKIATSYDSDWVYDPATVDPDDEPDNGDRWYAEMRESSHGFVSAYGPTLLVAAMRCFVASQLGDEVEVPDALCSS